MKAVIQRVSGASVTIGGKVYGEIPQGLCVLLGIENADGGEDVKWLCKKILSMRLFADENGKMNLSCEDIGGSVLVVSQFTLHASTKKGNRPSFIKAAHPDYAIPLYEEFVQTVRREIGDSRIATGQFGADMQLEIHNDGPVTIVVDSQNRV